MNGIHDIAEELLLSLPRANIIAQLRSKGVARVILEDMGDVNGRLCEGICDTADSELWRIDIKIIPGIFSIALSVKDELSDWVLGVGHELGHIFCYYDLELGKKIHSAFGKKYRIELPESVNMDTPREDLHRYCKTRHLSEELFCEIFSSLWVNYRNNNKELRNMLSPLSRHNSKVIIEELLPPP